MYIDDVSKEPKNEVNTVNNIIHDTTFIVILQGCLINILKSMFLFSTFMSTNMSRMFVNVDSRLFIFLTGLTTS